MSNIILKLKQPINTSLQSNTGDIIYFVKMDNGQATGNIKKLGECIAISKDNEYFNVTVSVGNNMETPDPDDYLFFGKNSVVGASGVTGYFAEVEMKSDSTDSVELFAVGSDIVESSK
tara:strand:- start:5855 stop:6208 length:354 start_codon:yes stop_codon:yes gene_type:complete